MSHLVYCPRLFQNYKIKESRKAGVIQFFHNADISGGGIELTSRSINQKLIIMDCKKLSKVYRRLKFLSCQTNIHNQIINMLDEFGPLNQTELWIKTRLNNQSQVAHSIRMLKMAKIIRYKKQGTFMIYSLNYQEIENINIALENFANPLKQAA